MRVAIIERFSNPSRNCDTDQLAEDEVHVVRLRGGDRISSEPESRMSRTWHEAARSAALPGRCLIALASILVNRQLSAHDKVSLIRSALSTRGAPAAALAATPEILRLLRSGQFDRIDCFATRGFALVPFLGQLFNIAHREFLSDSTRYFGEFAFELLAVVPYAYWLHRTSRLRITQSSADTKCLYYFSPDHQEVSSRRSYIPVTEYPNGATSAARFDVHAFPTQLDITKWVPPPYKSIYRNTTFKWSKELCIVCNKFTPEPSARFHRAVNFISVADLLPLLQILTPHFQVVYVRPQASDIVNDHQPIQDFGDFQAIESHFPEVLTIQQLHVIHPELTFNELQMRLFANSERFISVLGGSSYLASYFGGTNIVYARQGWEVNCDAYARWFHLFSGARVLRAGNPRELRDLVRQEFGSHNSREEVPSM